MSEFDRRMLEALVCPQTRAPLKYDAEAQELVSRPLISRFQSATVFP